MTLSACHVTFHSLQHSEALEKWIHERAIWLQQFAPIPFLVHARIDAPHRHRHEHAIRVHLRIVSPDLEPIVVEREDTGDVYALVSDTFDIARRRLQDAIREQRGFVKTHSSP